MIADRSESLGQAHILQQSAAFKRPRAYTFDTFEPSRGLKELAAAEGCITNARHTPKIGDLFKPRAIRKGAGSDRLQTFGERQA